MESMMAEDADNEFGGQISVSWFEVLFYYMQCCFHNVTGPRGSKGLLSRLCLSSNLLFMDAQS